MVDGRNNGIPLVIQSPKAGITHAFRRLADQVDHVPEVVSEILEEKETSSQRWKKFWPGLSH